MTILYENENLAICEKPTGLVSQSTPDGKGFADLAAKHFGYAAIINRLDTVVGGAVLFAKDAKTAALLSAMASDRTIDKVYLAVVEGTPSEDRGTYEDLLFKDSRKNKSYVVKRLRKGVKKASLEYEVIDTANAHGKVLTLVKIKLHTGRTHQIRVQFASRKMPLCGDGKYGSNDNRCSVALWSHCISLQLGKNDIVASSLPPSEAYPWNLFNISDVNF